MDHVEFWKEFINKLGLLEDWVVFENGTLVIPYLGFNASQVLEMLDHALHVDFREKMNFAMYIYPRGYANYWTTSFQSSYGTIWTYCKKEDFPAYTSPDEVMHCAIYLGIKQRNLDAKSRVVLFDSNKDTVE
ncbi:hypothetical protein [Nitrosomonas sp. Nm34]|uniref:hypothetical protein n=1 Tax=Nitrosomonas sp. Nm34 TaxID=1881055 RepID=UPI0008E583A3|nr:hypothetical protein [Nitrosomonas sp. Nm34]SFI82525.1 hypothetical protein SAMN05428978_104128 [Nitrosomonas sp. Nm34]